jgi:peptide-methionine (S)-S-oxide reductase
MMDYTETFDSLFRDAVAAIDAGDVAALDGLLAAHPRLVRERLEAPGAWLRDKVGRAVEAGGFFARPYLLWFVAEDPIRNGKLPTNIARVARTIIEAAERGTVESLQEQLDYALGLVAWSGVASECGVQIELMDVLIDAGASTEGVADNALVNGHVAAAENLIERGAKLTLAGALCLGRWDEVTRLAAAASARDKQMAFVLAALNGKAEALRRMIDLGVDLDRPSKDLYAHGTPLHHAVCSGSLDAVKVLVEAGADLAKRDTNNDATPLGWAEHYIEQKKGKPRGQQYAQIAAYLREKGGKD